MVSISQLRKNELYDLAVDAGFDLPKKEVERRDLIEYLRDNSSLVDPTKVNRGQKINGNEPTITVQGEKIEVDYKADFTGISLISNLIDRVIDRTQELYGLDHHADRGQFCEIASLILNACGAPDLLTLDTIITYKRAATTVRFYSNCYRSVCAVMRDYPRGYSSAVQCAIVDSVNGFESFSEEEKSALLDEVWEMKKENRDGGSDQPVVGSDAEEWEEDESTDFEGAEDDFTESD